MSHTGYASLINTIIIKIILHTYLIEIYQNQAVMKKRYFTPTIEYLEYETGNLLITSDVTKEGAEQDFAKENEFFFNENENDDSDFWGDPFSLEY